MAITLDATVGGVSSNSYVTLVRASTLLEQLPHAEEWQSAVDVHRVQLLVQATRLIDRMFEFNGSKTSTAQALEWPREGVRDYRTGDAISSAIVPDFVEWATVEWAYALHLDAESGRNLAPGIRTLRRPSYTVEFTGSGSRRMPQEVMDLLLPYGDRAVTGMVRLGRA